MSEEKYRVLAKEEFATYKEKLIDLQLHKSKQEGGSGVLWWFDKGREIDEFAICEIDGEFIGWCLKLGVKNVYVRPDFRKKGIGTRLWALI